MILAHLTRRDGLVACLFGVAALALYGYTAAPSVATLFDDSLEFQVVLPTLGIAHPSGYPLYTLVGKLFSRIPLPVDPAGRINLLSALFAAAAVGVLYLVIRKLAGSAPAAATAVAIFAISPTWWSQATIAEVYALHGLFVACFIFFLLRWEEGQAAGVAGDLYLWLAALTFGCGLAHHRMIALLLPASLIFVLWSDAGVLRRPARWLPLLAFGAAPLLLYLYLPLRGQSMTSLDGNYVPTLRGTLDWVLARGYSVFITANPFGVDRDFGDYLGLIMGELGALAMIAGAIGIWKIWDFGHRRAVFLLVATAAQFVFGALYKVEDIAVFFIPAIMLLTAWAAIGLAPIFDSFALRAAHAFRSARPPVALRPILLLLWLAPTAFIMLFEPGRAMVRSFEERNRRDDWTVYEAGEDMVANAAQGGEIIGLLGETTLVRYFRDVLGQRLDLLATPADAETARYTSIENALSAGRPVYLTRDLPGAAGRYSLDAVGPLIAVEPKAAPAPLPPGGAPIGAGVSIFNPRVEALQGRQGASVRVRFAWSSGDSVLEPLKVSVRLLDPTGQQIAAADAVPVHFTYPTTAWVPGELVEDSYDLPFAITPLPGSYSIVIILYRAADAAEVGRYVLPGVTLA